METADGFAPYVGRRFVAESGRTLELMRIQRHPGHDPSFREPFTLLFRGPPGDVLPEGFCEFALEDGKRAGFHIMPINTMAPDRQEYQAVFN